MNLQQYISSSREERQQFIERIPVILSDIQEIEGEMERANIVMSYMYEARHENYSSEKMQKRRMFLEKRSKHPISYFEDLATDTYDEYVKTNSK